MVVLLPDRRLRTIHLRDWQMCNPGLLKCENVIDRWIKIHQKLLLQPSLALLSPLLLLYACGKHFCCSEPIFVSAVRKLQLLFQVELVGQEHIRLGCIHPRGIRNATL